MTAWMPMAAALLAMSFWAISFVATKVALLDMRPETMIWLRHLLGLLTVGLLVWLRGHWEKPTRADLPQLALVGLVGVVLHQLQAYGMLTTTATVSAWLAALGPALMAVMAWFWLHEPFVPRQAVWLVLAGIGAVLVSAGSLPAMLRGGFGDRGDLLVLASSIIWAPYSILLKRLVQTRRASMVTLMALFMSCLILLPMFLLQGGWDDLAYIGTSGWLSVLVLGVGSTGLAGILYNYALKHLSSTVAAVLQYPEPLLVTVISGLILHESFTPSQAFGGLLILFGVWRVKQTSGQPGHQMRSG